MTAHADDITSHHTLARNENIKRLLVALGQRPMRRDEICDFLHYSPSGGRKYISLLREARVIELVDHEGGRAGYIGMPIYGLTDDSERIAAYLESLAAPRDPVSSPPRSQIAIASRDPARHFHIIRDDIAYPVRVSRAAVVVDPYSLPREFFASVGAASCG